MVHRKRHRGLVLLAGSVLALGACGGSDDDGEDPAGASGAERAPATQAEAAFPAEVEHQYGTTVVEDAPERVVTVGYNDQDFVLAFGVEPVAVRWWYGPEDDATQPWTDDLVGDDEPKVLVMPELNLEAVAAERPDLIIGVYSGMTQEEYGQLSEIAPTIAQSGDYVDYGMPWQEVTRSIGTALGQPDTADELVADVEARFAEISDAHPDWTGKSVAVATSSPDEFSFFASEDPRSRFFRKLGFEVPPELDEIAGDLFYGTISKEKADLLDRDLLVWDQLSFVDGGRAAIEGEPLLAGLAAMREGRAIYLEGELEAAFGWNTILSIPIALDGIEALVAEALS